MYLITALCCSFQSDGAAASFQLPIATQRHSSKRKTTLSSTKYCSNADQSSHAQVSSTVCSCSRTCYPQFAFCRWCCWWTRALRGNRRGTQPAQHLALLSTALHPGAPAPICLPIFISTSSPHWSAAAAHSPVLGEEGQGRVCLVSFCFSLVLAMVPGCL